MSNITIRVYDIWTLDAYGDSTGQNAIYASEPSGYTFASGDTIRITSGPDVFTATIDSVGMGQFALSNQAGNTFEASASDLVELLDSTGAVKWSGDLAFDGSSSSSSSLQETPCPRPAVPLYLQVLEQPVHASQ